MKTKSFLTLGTSLYFQLAFAVILSVLVYGVWGPNLISSHDTVNLWVAVGLMLTCPVLLVYLVVRAASVLLRKLHPNDGDT